MRKELKRVLDLGKRELFHYYVLENGLCRMGGSNAEFDIEIKDLNLNDVVGFRNIKDLKKVLKAGKDEIEIAVEKEGSNKFLVVKDGLSKIKMLSDDTFIVNKIGLPYSYAYEIDIDNDIRETLKLADELVAEDDRRYEALSCVLFDIENNKMVLADGHILLIRDIEYKNIKEDDTKKIFIWGKYISQLFKKIKNNKLYLDKKELSFVKYGDVVLISRILDNPSYPDYIRVMERYNEKETNATGKIDIENTLKAMKTIKTMIDKYNYAIKLKNEGEVLKLTFKNNGNVLECNIGKVEGEIDVYLNYTYFESILKLGVDSFQFKNKKDAIVFNKDKVFNKNKTTVYLMPMNLED